MNSERFDVHRPDEWVFIRPVSDRHWQETKPEFKIKQIWSKICIWLNHLDIFNVSQSFVGYTKGKSFVRR